MATNCTIAYLGIRQSRVFVSPGDLRKQDCHNSVSVAIFESVDATLCFQGVSGSLWTEILAVKKKKKIRVVFVNPQYLI